MSRSLGRAGAWYRGWVISLLANITLITVSELNISQRNDAQKSLFTLYCNPCFPAYINDILPYSLPCLDRVTYRLAVSNLCPAQTKIVK